MLKDGLLIRKDGSGRISLSLGGENVSSASIALSANNKGFLPNVVFLTSTVDLVTIPDPVEGMIVYNAAKTENNSNNVVPGYYVYIDNSLQQVETGRQITSNSNIILKTALTTTTTDQTLNFNNIEILESGYFVYSLNLFATASPTTGSYNIKKGIYFLSLYKKSIGDSDFSMVDNAEINLPTYISGESFSYNIFLLGFFNSGDQVQIRVKNASGYPSATFSAQEYVGTKLSYWKI